MLEAAFFGHDRVPGDVLHLANNRLAVEVGESHAVGSDYSQVAIGKKKKIAGVVENRGDVRCDKIFVFAQTDNGGRAITRGNNLVGLIDGNHREREHASELDNRLPHSFFERWAMTVSGLKKILFDQVRDNFRVGLSGEAMSLFRQ